MDIVQALKRKYAEETEREAMQEAASHVLALWEIQFMAKITLDKLLLTFGFIINLLHDYGKVMHFLCTLHRNIGVVDNNHY